MDIPNFFPGDRYDTPDGVARPVGDRLLLGSRWYFYLMMLDIQRRYSAIARTGGYDRAAWVRSSIEAFRLLESVGCRFRLSGLDHLRRDPAKPLVIAGNHMSTLETMVFPGIIGGLRPVTFVIKENILHNPLYRDIMAATRPIVVSRKNPRDDLKKVLEEGTAHLREGTSVILFPQATRSDTFDPAQFNSLGVKLAKTAGVRLMPVAIKTDFWGNSRFRLLKVVGPLHRERPVHMDFGAPIAITGNGTEEHHATVEFIQTRLAEWGTAPR
ncbi:MAG TPA: lysophospholipid acyltransferase family protein [bacterium]|nr:lysophospholipid acyltransferase family protein [bacterium]